MIVYIVNTILFSQGMVVALLVLAGSWFAFGGRITALAEGGQTTITHPYFVYWSLAKVFYGLNAAISLALYSPLNGPAQPDWDEDASVSPQKGGAMTAELEALKESLIASSPQPEGADQPEAVKEENLIRLYDLLPAATTVQLRNPDKWKGRVVHSGRFLDLADKYLVQPFRAAGITWGKRYPSHHTGDPLLLSFNGKVHFPLPVWGNVSNQTIEYRGKSTATMLYDEQPWQDYFVVLDDGRESGKTVLLGIWTSREKSGGWFTLSSESGKGEKNE